jgi:hypothetical protein
VSTAFRPHSCSSSARGTLPIPFSPSQAIAVPRRQFWARGRSSVETGPQPGQGSLPLPEPGPGPRLGLGPGPGGTDQYRQTYRQGQQNHPALLDPVHLRRTPSSTQRIEFCCAAVPIVARTKCRLAEHTLHFSEYIVLFKSRHLTPQTRASSKRNLQGIAPLPLRLATSSQILVHNSHQAWQPSQQKGLHLPCVNAATYSISDWLLSLAAARGVRHQVQGRKTFVQNSSLAGRGSRGAASNSTNPRCNC